MRPIAILGLAAVLGLSSCQTMQNARDRLVRTPKVCQEVTVPIYFEPNVADVTPEGRRVIAAAAAQARGCRVEAVRVMGLADAAGDPAANLELSKRRATSVADAIARARLPAAEFDVGAAGQAGAVTKAGQVQPVRRRADVTLKLKAPK